MQTGSMRPSDRTDRAIMSMLHGCRPAAQRPAHRASPLRLQSQAVRLAAIAAEGVRSHSPQRDNRVALSVISVHLRLIWGLRDAASRSRNHRAGHGGQAARAGVARPRRPGGCNRRIQSHSRAPQRVRAQLRAAGSGLARCAAGRSARGGGPDPDPAAHPRASWLCAPRRQASTCSWRSPSMLRFEQARAVVDAVERAGRKLGVVFQYRFRPGTVDPAQAAAGRRAGRACSARPAPCAGGVRPSTTRSPAAACAHATAAACS